MYRHAWFNDSANSVEMRKRAMTACLPTILPLFLAAAVFRSVVLGGLVCVMFRVQVLAVGRMRVVCALLVVSCFVMLRRFLVVRRGMFMMLRCLFMVLGSLVLSHIAS